MQTLNFYKRKPFRKFLKKIENIFKKGLTVNQKFDIIIIVQGKILKKLNKSCEQLLYENLGLIFIKFNSRKTIIKTF